MNKNYEYYFFKINTADFMDCDFGYIDPEDCSWYHHNWMTLRSLDMVSNPFWHKQFFTDQLQGYFSKGSKVLVLGTADFSMPLLCTYAGIKELHICDICKTPLNICNNIAKQNQFKWNTFLSDINQGIDGEYDIIINDAFLTRFGYNEKRNILYNISNALSLGGVYITTIRKGWNHGKAVIPTKNQKEKFVEQALKLAQEKGYDTELTRDSAATYIEHITSYPMKSKKSIIQMAIGIMNINSCVITQVTGEYKPTNYFQVVFQRQ